MMKLNVANAQIGTTITGAALLLRVEELLSKKNTVYCNVLLTNGKENIHAKYWGPYSDLVGKMGKVVIVKLKTDQFMNQPSCVVSEIKETMEYAVKDFIRRPPISEEFMFEKILKIVKTGVTNRTSEKNLTDLTEAIYKNNQEKLLVSSAAKEMHHNFRGGLLYHTYRMLLQAKAIAEIYPDLNKELLFLL